MNTDCCEDCRTPAEESRLKPRRIDSASEFSLTFQCDGEAGDVVVLTKKSPYIFRGEKFIAEDGGIGTSVLVVINKKIAILDPIETNRHLCQNLLGGGVHFPIAQINEYITLFVFFPKKGSWSGMYHGMAMITDHPHVAV